MIKASVLYPNTPGRIFDMDYYCTRHLSMVRKRLGAACKEVAGEQGLAHGTPRAPPTFIAMGHAYFNSVAAFEESWDDTRRNSLRTD